MFRKFNGTLEDLISDLDDVLESYMLFVNDGVTCYIYEPEDVDTVNYELLDRKVKKFLVKKEKKGVIVDVYLV